MFERGFKLSKCKNLLNSVIARISQVRNKRGAHIRQLRKDVAQLLQSGQDASARKRVDIVMREQNILDAYALLEKFCELVLARLSVIKAEKNCPLDTQEAISSLIFAGTRSADLPELLELRSIFEEHYGKKFVVAAVELQTGCGVNKVIIEKLSGQTASEGVRVQLMKEIAADNRVHWSPKVSDIVSQSQAESKIAKARNKVALKEAAGKTSISIQDEVNDDSVKGHSEFQSSLTSDIDQGQFVPPLPSLPRKLSSQKSTDSLPSPTASLVKEQFIPFVPASVRKSSPPSDYGEARAQFIPFLASAPPNPLPSHRILEPRASDEGKDTGDLYKQNSQYEHVGREERDKKLFANELSKKNEQEIDTIRNGLSDNGGVIITKEESSIFRSSDNADEVPSAKQQSRIEWTETGFQENGLQPRSSIHKPEFFQNLNDEESAYRRVDSSSEDEFDVKPSAVRESRRGFNARVSVKYQKGNNFGDPVDGEFEDLSHAHRRNQKADLSKEETGSSNTFQKGASVSSKSSISGGSSAKGSDDDNSSKGSDRDKFLYLRRDDGQRFERVNMQNLSKQNPRMRREKGVLAEEIKFDCKNNSQTKISSRDGIRNPSSSDSSTIEMEKQHQDQAKLPIHKGFSGGGSNVSGNSRVRGKLRWHGSQQEEDDSVRHAAGGLYSQTSDQTVKPSPHREVGSTNANVEPSLTRSKFTPGASVRTQRSAKAAEGSKPELAGKDGSTARNQSADAGGSIYPQTNFVRNVNGDFSAQASASESSSSKPIPVSYLHMPRPSNDTSSSVSWESKQKASRSPYPKTESERDSPAPNKELNLSSQPQQTSSELMFSNLPPPAIPKAQKSLYSDDDLLSRFQALKANLY